MPNLGSPGRRARFISVASIVLASTILASAAYADCPTKENRCGKEWAFCPDWPELAPIVGEGCANIPAGCPRPSHCPAPVKSSCGEYWTQWSDLGEPVANPCPASCVQTEMTDRDSRNANEFFKVQYREKWSCAGTPPSSKAKTARK